MSEQIAEARLRCSSITLEDGADEAFMHGEPIGICEGGIRFPSRWQFEPGTTLALTLEVCGTTERVRSEVVVVGCEALGLKLWAVTVLFLEEADMARIQQSKNVVKEGFSGLLV